MSDTWQTLGSAARLVVDNSKQARDARLGKVPPPTAIDPEKNILRVRVTELQKQLADSSSALDMALERGQQLTEEADALRRRVAVLEGHVTALGKQIASMPQISSFLNNSQGFKEVVPVVAEHFGLTWADMLGNRRQSVCSRPRQIAMYLAKKLTADSYPEIAKCLNRDHTTVIYGVQRIESLIETDAQLAGDIAAIIAKLRGVKDVVYVG